MGPSAEIYDPFSAKFWKMFTCMLARSPAAPVALRGALRTHASARQPARPSVCENSGLNFEARPINLTQRAALTDLFVQVDPSVMHWPSSVGEKKTVGKHLGRFLSWKEVTFQFWLSAGISSLWRWHYDSTNEGSCVKLCESCIHKLHSTPVYLKQNLQGLVWEIAQDFSERHK